MPGSTEEQIKVIVEGTRKALLRATEAAFPVSSEEQPLDLSVRFQGCCGLAQCVAGYALQDEGLAVHPLATQSLENYRHGHAALTVKVEESGGNSHLFIIDPTFCQFTSNPVSGFGAVAPATHLQQTPEGASLLAEILMNGFAELTRERAVLYLDAFCAGNSGLGIRAAFDFVNNPPAHPYHFRRDTECDAFSRDNLANMGWLISP